MDVQQLVQAMTPQIYDNLRNAVETGKWPDGTPLTEEQKENSLQAVLLYQSRIEQSEQHMTIGKDGEVVQKSKSQLRQELQQEATNQSPIARFKQDDI
ncbi:MULTISPECIES: DUF1315 family protein [Alteromonadaceae]|jgi:uncharacterized protein YeaC (DUF1315 family)|uniref:DUF1315 family protein n=1 Tax=Brumicola blandensis TaxID=3075611 RepID=A0AAW8QZ49_9ALTE|nr:MULTISPECIES: DUF1315 family protein [unclassified Alteromonas]MDT0581794.1 DUF1315 family protein [Alteromonas sp. W409]MDT0629845.1 DUF1315 family protein [Alteromonas sp. W364]